jgi:branched-chain amino acid transport system permease protein
MRVLSVAGIYALLTIGYSFIFGMAGALSLAQGTFMGVGAYVSGILATRFAIPFDAALPVSVLAPVLLALLVAAPVLRLHSHSFALATLLIGQIALLVATQWQSVTGGANGIGGVPPLSLLGASLSSRSSNLLVVWLCVAAGAGFAWQFGRGRLSDAYALLRTNPTAASSIGIDIGKLRFVAFLWSAAYAGLAGSLYVHTIGVLSPDVLGFPVMITCLTIAVLGSRTSVTGLIVAAVFITELPEWVRPLRDDYMLAFGVILLFVVVAVPEGLADAAKRLLRRLLPIPRSANPTPAPLPICRANTDGTLLVVTGLGHSFGGVRALDDISLALQTGEILGVIGPNGAGKTTLLNAITGIFPPDTGAVAFDNRVITTYAPDRIARLGITRTFQTASLVGHLTALDNVAVARGGRLQVRRECFADPAKRRHARAEAMALLADLGASAAAGQLASTLPPGLARLVELARALACEPRLLLLDEPASGLNAIEQAGLAKRLRHIADTGIALLVIEHNMPFLAPLVDRMICLDHGRLIAAGTPEAVQNDKLVIEAYLGAPMPATDISTKHLT